MRDLTTRHSFLEQAAVAEPVFALRPDYRALLLAVDGIEPGPSDAATEQLLQQAEEGRRTIIGGAAGGGAAARRGLAGGVPGVRRQAAAHPQQPGGAAAPRRDRAAPGEPAHRRLQRRVRAAPGPARRRGPRPLRRAAPAGPRHRRRSCSTRTAGGETVVEHPDPGEVVWCDGAGVTCRRWNWRQARRTQLTDSTTAALFILDALAPLTDDALLRRRRRPDRTPAPARVRTFGLHNAC